MWSGADHPTTFTATVTTTMDAAPVALVGVADDATRLGIVGRVSQRLDKSWRVLASHQTYEGDRCVDIFWRPDDTFGFEEFRRDPEDMGTWTPVAYFSAGRFTTEDGARAAAARAVPWLARLLDH